MAWTQMSENTWVDWDTGAVTHSKPSIEISPLTSSQKEVKAAELPAINNEGLNSVLKAIQSGALTAKINSDTGKVDYIPFDQQLKYQLQGGNRDNVLGLNQTSDNNVYSIPIDVQNQGRYEVQVTIDPSTGKVLPISDFNKSLKFNSFDTSSKLGNIADALTVATASYLGGPLAVGALNLFQGNSLEDSAKAAAISYAAQQAFSASDPNAVGGVTGPDNIDVGGGWSPATGATAAELEAARLALEAPPQLSGYDAAMADLANAQPAFDGSQVTPAQITSEIASTQPTATPTGDNIDAGGGWSPSTGATAAELEAARIALEQPVITKPITSEAITNEIAGTTPTPIQPATPEVDPYEIYGSGANQWGGNGEYIDLSAVSGTDLGGTSPATGATEAELDKARAAMQSTGWTFNQALDAVRAGLLVNAITGDPLGLGGGQPEQAPSGSTGFAMVPVPTDWKSPTYTNTPVQNVSFEDLFPGVSLQGTQWAGLQNAQPNMSFNDIFASGLQSTPMGMPVNIQDIVGSIIGQSAKS